MPALTAEKTHYPVVLSAVFSILHWLSIVVPPGVVLQLAFLPYDLPTALFWLTGAFFFLLSVATISLRWFYENTRTLKPYLRASLTLIAFLLAAISHHTSLYQAQRFTSDTAQKLLVSCQQGSCPTTIDGWAEASSRLCEGSSTSAGGLVEYTVSYCPSNDRQSFELKLRINFDESYSFTLENDVLVGTYNNF